MSAKDLESALREGGEKVGEGRIRIDSARALQRLKDFRFADPSHWVLEVLRAATLSYAKNVEVRTDSDDVEISFDGKSFPTDSMKSLLEQALNAANTPDEKRTRLLSLGVAGALGVTASFVKVSSGGVALTLSGDEVQLEEAKTKGTQLHLRKAFGWRVAAAFFRGSPEARAITASAQRFPGTLNLNGEVVKLGAQKQVGTKTVEGKGFRLEARLPVGPPLATSRIEIDVAGVVVAEREKRLPGLQLEVWLRADDMRRNASGSDVVDDDEIFEAAMLALRKVSRDLLNEHGEKLAADSVWRTHFKEQLKEEASLDAQVKQRLHKLPLFSDPAGAGISIEQISDESRERSIVYIARREYPKGSFPEATVLLEGEHFAFLLPEGKRVDVAELVKSKQKIALARARHEQMEVEEAVLHDRNWIARAKIAATAVDGEVGFEVGGNGAFVRVLHKGRLMESGELTALSPLRLRAVVDWNRPLGDSYFSNDEGGSKLLGLVLKYIEHTATRAICEALPKPEVLPHALDLLTRLVTNRNVPFTELPPELKAAPLFPCLESDHVSLDAFYAEPKWHFVESRRNYGFLGGGRVLVLTSALRDVLRKLAARKLEDVTQRLRDEEDVRRRLAGPKQLPELQHVGVKVAIDEAGVRGEVGIPTVPGNRLLLTVLKDGLLLETTELTPRYSRAAAAIDCEALTPNPRWDGAVRDDVFKRVVGIVHNAQRLLAAELVREKRSQWKFGADQFFIAFLKKQLVPFDPEKLDDVTRVVVNAPVFESMQGPRSLMQIREQVKRDNGRFYVMTNRRDVPPDFEVLVELPGVSEVLGEILGVKPEDPTSALATLDARQRLQALPLAEFKLPAPLPLEVRHTNERFTVLAGLREGVGDQASGHVHLDGRVYSVILIPCALPLEVVIDAPTFEPNAFREITADQRQEIVKLVSSAMQLVVKKALDAPENDPAARRAMLVAIGRGLDSVLPPEDAERLLTRALLPCTDGKLRSVRQCDEESPQFVTSELEGELPNRRSIINASEAPVRLAVSRWPRAVKVDGELEVQNLAMKKRASVAKVEEVVSSVKSPWRQKVKERDLTGEIVVTHKNVGRLEVFLDKKPLCVLENALPAPLAGAIDSPRFTPMPGFKGVVEDGNFKEAIEALTGSAERLAAQLASAPRVMELDPASGGRRRMPEGDLSERMDTALVQLAFWVGSTLAWQWKGKKKAKGKGGKKKENVETQHPLMAKEILRANDSTTLSLQDLVERQREDGRVDVTKHGGKFLEQGRKVWWPKVDEEKWAEPLGFSYRDVSSELLLAESIRKRPKFDMVDSPLPSPWRERITTPGMEGEIAIGHAPDGKLAIEVLHERMLMETWWSEHPIGGMARVDSSALTPNDQWNGVKRDAAFKSLVTATESALERLLVRRLAASGSRPFAIAAVKWRSGQAGPLAGVVPSLELFQDLKGGPMTVGEVFELARKKGKVPVASPTFTNDATGVVHDSPETRSVLALLGLVPEDVTGELRRAKNLEQALTARRLESLTWKGESLVKVNLNTVQLKGELAIRTGIPEKDDSRVTIAKDGISIGALDQSWPGVVGVIDVKELTVNDDWTHAEPTRAQRSLIREQVERLYAELAVKAPTYSHEQREVALTYALRFLMDEGTRTASELPRLKGVSAELASAPLFLTAEGEKVTLRAVADEVNSRERVSVLTRSMGSPHGITSCVLATSSMNAPWLASLEDLFGKTKVWRVTDLAEWSQSTREADPPEGAPELQGLRFLRREVRLLRTGALGHLTPDDLEDVKLSRAGGGTALRYDKKRKLVLLDPEHPDIARALKEAQQRPERLWALLASLFGLVNRELTHVTDVHEAQLLLALAGHLASNPKLLPTEPS